LSSTLGIDYSGQTVLVTGAAQGIGRAICLGFARSGANVICADIDQSAGQEVTELAAPLSGAVAFIPTDFCDPSACEKLVETALEMSPHGRVDTLVNNVGIQTDNGLPVHLLDEDTWDQVMNVNLKSYFLSSKYCLPPMLEAGRGVIINIGSVQGHQSQVGIPAYASSKGAVLSLTRQMAMDYSNSGVRVVSVSPGTIRTPLVERLVVEDGQTCEALVSSECLNKNIRIDSPCPSPQGRTIPAWSNGRPGRHRKLVLICGIKHGEEHHRC
jgi:NAD(P)-dependent dehydrogenase (short-subunit alcohol dehydrogenase family)